jgi:hypothetical protein
MFPKAEKGELDIQRHQLVDDYRVNILAYWWFGTFFPFHIWDVILAIDELHHFSRWLLHHQPAFIQVWQVG